MPLSHRTQSWEFVFVYFFMLFFSKRIDCDIVRQSVNEGMSLPLQIHYYCLSNHPNYIVNLQSDSTCNNLSLTLPLTQPSSKDFKTCFINKSFYKSVTQILPSKRRRTSDRAIAHRGAAATNSRGASSARGAIAARVPIALVSEWVCG